jgi:hypothetical protein
MGSRRWARRHGVDCRPGNSAASACHAVNSGRGLLSSAAATCGESCRAPGWIVDSALRSASALADSTSGLALAWRHGERKRARCE